MILVNRKILLLMIIVFECYGESEESYENSPDVSHEHYHYQHDHENRNFPHSMQPKQHQNQYNLNLNTNINHKQQQNYHHLNQNLHTHNLNQNRNNKNLKFFNRSLRFIRQPINKKIVHRFHASPSNHYLSIIKSKFNRPKIVHKIPKKEIINEYHETKSFAEEHYHVDENGKTIPGMKGPPSNNNKSKEKSKGVSVELKKSSNENSAGNNISFLKEQHMKEIELREEKKVEAAFDKMMNGGNPEEIENEDKWKPIGPPIPTAKPQQASPLHTSVMDEPIAKQVHQQKHIYNVEYSKPDLRDGSDFIPKIPERNFQPNYPKHFLNKHKEFLSDGEDDDIVGDNSNLYQTRIKNIPSSNYHNHSPNILSLTTSSPAKSSEATTTYRPYYFISQTFPIAQTIRTTPEPQYYSSTTQNNIPTSNRLLKSTANPLHANFFHDNYKKSANKLLTTAIASSTTSIPVTTTTKRATRNPNRHHNYNYHENNSTPTSTPNNENHGKNLNSKKHKNLVISTLNRGRIKYEDSRSN